MGYQVLSSWVSKIDGWYSRGRVSRSINARSALVFGDYLPDATNTGTMSAPTTLLTTTQNLSDTGGLSPAKTFEGVEFRCQVNLSGKNYVFRNCLFSGVAAGMGISIVQSRYATASDNLFEDCTFAAYTPTDGVNGIQGRGFTLKRCNIYGVVDGVNPAVADSGTRVDVAMYGCYIHDLLRYCPDGPYSSHSDNQTHSDSIQWQGGLGLTLVGNRIENLIDPTKGLGNTTAATYDGNGVQTGGNQFLPKHVGTAALMINALNNAIPPGELVLRKNWLRGGGVLINSLGASSTIRLVSAWEGAADGTVIDGNHIMNDQGFGTNHRWLKRTQQTVIANAMAAGSNYTWDGTAGDAFSTTPLPSFGVNN